MYIPNRFQQKLISRQLILALFSTQGLNLELNDIGLTIYGKPQILIQNQLLNFNISHTKNMTVAVCDPKPIGIDIESNPLSAAYLINLLIVNSYQVFLNGKSVIFFPL